MTAGAADGFWVCLARCRRPRSPAARNDQHLLSHWWPKEASVNRLRPRGSRRTRRRAAFPEEQLHEPVLEGVEVLAQVGHAAAEHDATPRDDVDPAAELPNLGGVMA